MKLKRPWWISGDDLVAKAVLLPAVIMSMVFVYGFIIFTIYLSFTGSKLLPSFDWVGLQNYTKLFKLQHWHIALTNMAIFFVLYLGIGTALGLLLAILIDLTNKVGYLERHFIEGMVVNIDSQEIGKNLKYRF